jgi:hypothetical protein
MASIISGKFFKLAALLLAGVLIYSLIVGKNSASVISLANGSPPEH